MFNTVVSLLRKVYVRKIFLGKVFLNNISLREELMVLEYGTSRNNHSIFFCTVEDIPEGQYILYNMKIKILRSP